MGKISQTQKNRTFPVAEIKGRRIAGKTKTAKTPKPKSTKTKAPAQSSTPVQQGETKMPTTDAKQARIERKLAESKARMAQVSAAQGKKSASQGGNVSASKGGGEKGTGTGLKKTGGGFRGAKASEFTQRGKGSQMRNNLRSMYQSTNNAGRRARMEKVANKYGFSLNAKVNQAAV